ncbi:MAG: FecR domain-containing protein [Chryseosolibacter sp.]
MAPKDLDKLIEKYLDGKCTEEECAFIDSWYAALGKHPDLAQSSENDQNIASAGERILRKVHSHTQPPVVDEYRETKSRSLFWRYTGIAASILLMLATAFFYILPGAGTTDAVVPQSPSPEFTFLENTTGATRRVILPDGSIVAMSPASKIRFSNNSQSSSRELFLEGEAYFDVAHNNERPFYVYADNIVTRVLGTSFIVRAMGHDEKVTVSVKTGKVTVYTRTATHKKTVLVPNQEAVYDRRTDLVATQAVPDKQIQEQKKAYTEMSFEETPVPEVLAVLTKAYDIDIVFQEDILSGCVLTSSFFEEGLYDRIDVICTAIGATYHIVDARIVIESNGCNIKPN